MFGHHSWIAYIVRERKHCPRTQFFTKQEALIVPPILPFSFSFSMSTCSNELDHTSDAAETHDPGQDSLLPSYSLFSFLPHSLLFSSQNKNVLTANHSPPLSDLSPFLSQCHVPSSKNRFLIFSSNSPVGFLKKLVPIFQRRSILPAPSSALSPS